MISKSIFIATTSGDLQSNFDPIFYTFLKENERLSKMDVLIPSVNQFLIHKKDYFVEYSDAVDMILLRYNTALRNIVSDLRRLFTPHVNRIRSCLDPGITEITWTNMEWETFTDRCQEDIENFAYLMSRANDIYTNR